MLTTRNRMRTVVSGIAVLLLSVVAAQGDEGDSGVLKYRFQVGQHFLYRGGNELHFNGGQLVTRDSWHVWVVRENPDHSWRLLLRRGILFQHRRAEDGNNAKAVPQNDARPERITFGWCDIFPDGRVVENRSHGIMMRPLNLLPRLPTGQAEIDGGWTVQTNAGDETVRYKLLPSTTADRRQIEMILESPQNTVFEIDEKTTFTFDAKRGIVESISSESNQGYAPKGQGTGKIELISLETIPAETCTQFANEAELYFASTMAYEEVEQRQDLKPDAFKTSLAEATGKLKKVGESLQTPELKERVTELLEQSGRAQDHYLTAAEDRTKLLGTPLEDWSLKDFEGTSHELKRYRGKVVVVDFWYRGCGYCIVGMPQIRNIATYFKDHPVAVLGLNYDDNEEDAKFVIEKLKLPYTNLKAVGRLEKYCTQGFPTLLILDQDGVIRDIHVGYSPTLRDDVVRKVEKLLDQKR